MCNAVLVLFKRLLGYHNHEYDGNRVGVSDQIRGVIFRSLAHEV